ncbi:MAG: rhodanese-like domain-containing protein [Alphaproteobacteria bacterium]
MSSNYHQVSEISPIDAWKILSANPAAFLVDVRTVNEWNMVGFPDLSTIGKSTIKLSWRLYPNMQVNNDFVPQLKSYITNVDSTVLFICRSGVRSLEAANLMLSEGYSNCFNISNGFEGSHNQPGQVKNGWKASNLPWEQH